jgi:hypothetical protein
MTSEEGLMTSVNYPHLYPINSECTWYIRAPPTAYVSITFFDLDLEDDRDFLLIGEGSFFFFFQNISKKYFLFSETCLIRQ